VGKILSNIYQLSPTRKKTRKGEENMVQRLPNSVFPFLPSSGCDSIGCLAKLTNWEMPENELQTNQIEATLM